MSRLKTAISIAVQAVTISNESGPFLQLLTCSINMPVVPLKKKKYFLFLVFF